MRIKSSIIKEQKSDNKDDEKDGDEQNIDKVFGRIKRHIGKAREKLTGRSDRFGDDVSNEKFKLQIAGKESQSVDKQDTTTFIGRFIIYLRKEKIEDSVIDAFINYIQYEDYDSDPLIDDIGDHTQGSNILNQIKQEHFNNILLRYAEEVNSMYMCMFGLSLH